MLDVHNKSKGSRQAILTSFTFYSDHTLDEIMRAMAEYEVEYRDGEELHFRIIEIGVAGLGLYAVEMTSEGEEVTGYEDTRAFADFIGKILRPYSYTWLEFSSDANVNWGWLVIAGQIPQPFTYEIVVNGKLLNQIIQELEELGYT